MSDQNKNTVQESSKKKWSFAASIYTVWASTFIIYEYLYILLTKYRKAAPLGMILLVGFLSLFIIPIFIIIALCSIPYWLKNRKKDPVRAVIPLLIVCITMTLYTLYFFFVAPHIEGSGLFYNYIIFEIMRWSSSLKG